MSYPRNYSPYRTMPFNENGSNNHGRPSLSSEREDTRIEDRLRKTRIVADDLKKDNCELKRYNRWLSQERHKLQDENKELKISKEENQLKWRNSVRECDSLKKENQDLLKITNAQKEELHKQISELKKQVANKQKNDPIIIKKLKDENKNLKRKVQYLEKQNAQNKLKAISVSHTHVKERRVFAKALLKMGKGDMQSNDKLFQDLRKCLDKLEAEQQIARKRKKKIICEEVRTQLDGIEEEEKQMVEKRADGKVQCGSCPKTFSTPGDLTRHLTVTHKIYTIDRSKNVIDFIDIADDDED